MLWVSQAVAGNVYQRLLHLIELDFVLGMVAYVQHPVASSLHGGYLHHGCHNGMVVVFAFGLLRNGLREVDFDVDRPVVEEAHDVRHRAPELLAPFLQAGQSDLQPIGEQIPAQALLQEVHQLHAVAVEPSAAGYAEIGFVWSGVEKDLRKRMMVHHLLFLGDYALHLLVVLHRGHDHPFAQGVDAQVKQLRLAVLLLFSQCQVGGPKEAGQQLLGRAVGVLFALIAEEAGCTLPVMDGIAEYVESRIHTCSCLLIV